MNLRSPGNGSQEFLASSPVLRLSCLKIVQCCVTLNFELLCRSVFCKIKFFVLCFVVPRSLLLWNCLYKLKQKVWFIYTVHGRITLKTVLWPTFSILQLNIFSTYIKCRISSIGLCVNEKVKAVLC